MRKENSEKEDPSLINFPSTSVLPITCEVPEEIEKLINAYRNYCSAEKAFFKLETNKDIFDTKDEPVAVSQELFSKLEKASAKMIANMLVENFEVFKSLQREEKLVVFGPIASRLMAFFASFITANNFPEENNTKMMRHYGFYFNLNEPLKFFGKNLEKLESIVALLRPIHQKVFDASMKLVKLKISETEFACLIALIVYNQIELMGFRQNECNKSKGIITKYLQSELFSTYGTSDGGFRFAEILTLQLNWEIIAMSWTHAMITSIFDDHCSKIYLIVNDTVPPEGSSSMF